MGTNIIHVPYRGAGPAMQDLMAGRIDFMCDIVSTALAQIRGDTVKAIATMSTSRVAVLPDLPTALEQGLADVDADGWNGFFFPKGTPEAIIARVNAATAETLDTPVVRKRIEDLGLFVPQGRGARLRLPRQAGGERARQVGTADQGGRRQRGLSSRGGARSRLATCRSRQARCRRTTSIVSS